MFHPIVISKIEFHALKSLVNDMQCFLESLQSICDEEFYKLREQEFQQQYDEDQNIPY